MGVFFASLLVLPAIECLLRLPFGAHLRSSLALGKKSARIIMAQNISDHWKERVLLRYAYVMAIHTLASALLFTGLVCVAILPALFLDLLFSPAPSTLESLVSLPGLAGMFLASVLYLYIRKRGG